MNQMKSSALIIFSSNIYIYKQSDQQISMSIPDTSTYGNFSNQTSDLECICNTNRLKQALQKFEDEQKLINNAKKFVNKIRTRKKQFQGKMLMIKRAQQQKKIEEQKKLQIEMRLQKQVEKSERKFRAQRNILFFNQRKNIRESNSNSPRKRKLSNVTEEMVNQNMRVRLPSLYEAELSQIKQQIVQNTPMGLKKTSRKPMIKRSLTEHRRSQNPVQEQPTKRLQSPKRKKKNQIREIDNERKEYMIKKNRTEEIQQYIERFKEVNQAIEAKSKKSWAQPKATTKRFTPFQNAYDLSISSRSRND